MEIYQACITLILVTDPLGNIPIVISLLKSLPTRRFLWVILREASVAFAVLIAFLILGGSILSGLGLSQAALQIAGGIILFLIAIRMIFPPESSSNPLHLKEEPFIVPLAIPLIAGPSAMATVILLGTTSTSLVGPIIALCVASAVGLTALLSSRVIMKGLGDRGVIAMERLMGMILTTLSVQMLLNGLTLFFKL